MIRVSADQATSTLAHRKRPEPGLKRNRPRRHPEVEGMRVCTKCQVNQPIDGYRFVPSRNTTRASCIRCDEDSERQRKLNAIKAYGGKCECCGEGHPAFLTFDHPDNNGAQHRKELKGVIIYRWLEKHGYPQGVVRLLCYNCNCARHFWSKGGECPHQSE